MYKSIIDTNTLGKSKLYDFELGHEGEVIPYNMDLYFVKWYDNNDPERIIKTSEGFYNKDNKKHGPHIYYYSSGAKKIETTFMNGNKHGREVAYLNNGRIHYSINYDSGIYHGEVIIMDDIDNCIYKKLHYKFGKYDGQQHIFYKGVLIHTFEYKDGIKDGIESHYDLKNKLMARWQWKDNKKNGNYNEYYSNGQLHIVTQYQDDLLDGTLIELDITGKQITRKTYLKGIEIKSITS